MSGGKNSEGNFLCRVNFSSSYENLFPAETGGGGGEGRKGKGGRAMKGSRYLHSTLPPFVSVTRSTLLQRHSSSGIGGERAGGGGGREGVIDARVVLPGHPVYREGVFVLLPGCRHWLRTCSAFLKSCHPCYGIDSPPSFPLAPSPRPSNPALFLVAATIIRRIVVDPHSPPSLLLRSPPRAIVKNS